MFLALMAMGGLIVTIQTVMPSHSGQPINIGLGIADLVQTLVYGGLTWWLWPKDKGRTTKNKREDLALQMQQNWEVYCAKVVEAGSVQAVSFPGISKANEYGLANGKATLYEMTTHRSGGGVGTRVHLGKLPIFVGGYQSHSVEDLEKTGVGEFALSNQRFLFLGSNRTVEIALKNVANVEIIIDRKHRPYAMRIHDSRHAKPLLFGVDNPVLLANLTKIAAQGTLDASAFRPFVSLAAPV